MPVWGSKQDCFLSRQRHVQLSCDFDDIATFVLIDSKVHRDSRKFDLYINWCVPQDFPNLLKEILILPSKFWKLGSCTLFDFHPSHVRFVPLFGSYQRYQNNNQLQRHFIMENFHARFMPLFRFYQHYQKQSPITTSFHHKEFPCARHAAVWFVPAL